MIKKLLYICLTTILNQRMKINISLLFSFFIFSSIFSQNSSVSGLVSDDNTKETIPMANISLKKQTEIISGITNKTLVQGTVSDLNGNFTISNIEPGNYILECSFIGYKTFKKEIKLNSSEDKYFNILISEEVNLLGDVVISAGKFEQNIEEVTVSMDVIKPKLIKSKNPVNMEVMMNQSPGVNIVDGQANIRGGSGWSYNTGSRVLVMIDDMPFLSGDRGTVEWDMIPMENISQIEVIKGASSALFGSSALNGVINIRTEYPTNKPKTEVSIFQGFYDKAKRESLNWWGDNPQYFSGVSFSHAEYKNNTGIVFGGNIFNDFGYQKGVENRRGRFNFSTKKDWKKLKGLSHGLNGNFMYSHNDDAIMYTNDSLGYIPLDEDPANYTQMMMNIDPYISYVNPLNNTKHDLKVRFFRDDYNPNGGRAAYSNVFYSDYQFQKTWEDINSFLPFTLNHLVSTSGLTRNKIFAHDDEVYGGKHNVSNYSFYSQVDGKINDNLNVSLGGRFEYFNFDGEVSSVPLIRSGVNYKIMDATFLRGSYGSGFRFPSIVERYVTVKSGPVVVYPNPELQPEGGWSAEIGIKQGLKIDEWKGFFDVAAFIMQYDDMIEFTFGRWDPLNQNVDSLLGLGFKCVNIGEARVSGIETSIGGNGKIGNVDISVLGSYTYINPIILHPDDVYYSYWTDGNNDGQIVEFATDYIVDENGNITYLFEDTNEEGIEYIDDFYEITYTNASSDNGENGNLLKYRNQHTFKFDVQADTKLFSTGLSVRTNSFMQNVDGIFEAPIFNDPQSALINFGIADARQRFKNGDVILDWRAAVKLNPHITISCIIDNLLNREYQIRPAYIGPPRTFTVKLDVKI